MYYKWSLFGLCSMAVAVVLWVGACGKTATDTPVAPDATGGDTPSAPLPGQLTVGGLNMTVPKDLAVTSPTADVSSETYAALVAAGQLVLGLTEPPPIDDGPSAPPPVGDPSAPPPGDSGSNESDYLAKVRKLQSVLAATEVADCSAALPRTYELAQGGLGHAACFGARMEFDNHPDTSADVVFGNGDVGIVWALADADEASGPACSTRVVNALMENTGAYGDGALGLHAMVACAGRLGGAALPAIGESVDMAPHLEGISYENLVVASATVAREADTAAGRPVYVTTVAGTLTDAVRGFTKNFNLTVRHVPQDDENAAYKGVIQYVIDDFEGDRDALISVAYDYAATGLKYRYRQWQTDNSAEAFDPVTYEIVAAESGPASWQEVMVDMDPYGFGKLVYVWTTIDALVFNTETRSDGTGVAYFGHTSMMETPVGTPDWYSITGYRCYPINPALPGVEKYSQFVQQQAFSFDSASKSWLHDSSKITFAPTGDCSWDGSGGPLRRYREVAGSQDQEVEILTGPISADLYPLADYQSQWTPPTAPSGL